MEHVIRGCGKRTPGGVYLVTEIGSHGIPVDHLLVDPPRPLIDFGGAWEMPKLGVAIVESMTEPGIFNVWDWVGESNYPYFPDFWEEGRRYGFSRKVSPLVDFSKLSGGSLIIGVHPKGYADYNQDELAKLYDLEQQAIFDGSLFNIPTENRIKHRKEDETLAFCIRFLWELVDEPSTVDRAIQVQMPRKGKEKMFAYNALRPPVGLEPVWTPAVTHMLPIHRIEVINDPVEGKHEKAMDRIEKSGTDLPAELVDE